MQYPTASTFVTVLSTDTLPYCLTMQKSLSAHIHKSILYVLCCSEEAYKALEQMEYENIYIISLSELEERNPTLLEYRKQATQKKYYAYLHTELVEYILYNNPLIDSLQYVSPYMYFLENPYIYHKNIAMRCTGYEEDSSIYALSEYICLENSAQGREVWNQYKKLYREWLLDNTLSYTEEHANMLLNKYIEREPNNVYCEEAKQIAFTPAVKKLQRRGRIVCTYKGAIVAGYMKQVIYYGGYGYSVPYITGNMIEQYYIQKYIIKPYSKELERMFYKCRLYTIPLYVAHRNLWEFLDSCTQYNAFPFLRV